MEQLNVGLLKKARREKNISTEEAAKIVNRDRSFIWRIENGITSPRTNSLLKLLDAYGVSVTDVFVRVTEGGNSNGIRLRPYSASTSASETQAI